METTKKGKCINFGNCKLADRKEIISLSVTEDFVCPECNADLEALPGSKTSAPPIKIIVGVVIVLLLAGGGVYFAMQGDGTENTGAETVASTETSSNSVKLHFDQTEVSLKKGEKSQLAPQVTPAESVVELAWKSDNESIVTVDQKGLLTAIEAGAANVTVNTGDSQAVIAVKVVKADDGTKPGGGGGSKLQLSSGTYTGQSKNGKPHGQGTLTYNKRSRIAKLDMEERYAEAGEYLTGDWHNGEIINGNLYGKDHVIKDHIIVGKAE